MADDEVSGFYWLDYVLFAVMLLVSLGIGIYAALSGGKQKTTSEFLVGNRQMSLLPVTASILMSFVSALLVLGNTAEMYLHGGQFFLQVIGVSLAYLATAYIVVPIIYPLKITSLFQYLTMRFNANYPRVAGDLILMVSQSLYMGVSMFAPATALEGATGFPDWATIIICGIVATIYTSIGGMKAVVWTDALQFIVYSGGIIAILGISAHEVGGLGEVWSIAKDQGRLDVWNFNMNPFEDRLTFWSCVIGLFFSGLGLAMNQTTVQRFVALKTERGAKISVILLAPALTIMFVLTCLTGFVVFAYYHTKGCDPLRAGKVSNSNQLLPRFIMEVIDYPGLPGIFISVLFAGALSTISSSISALAAITWKDLIEPFFQDLKETNKTIVTKILSVFFGGVSIAFAFGFKYVKGHVLQISLSLVTGAGGPLTGMFLAGFFFPWTNAIGVSIGAVASLAITMWLAVGQRIENPHVSYLETNVANCSLNATIKAIPTDPEGVFILYKVSFLWFATIGTLLTIIFALIISLITGPMKGENIDPRLMTPILEYIIPCLPKNIQQKFWCNVRYDERKPYTEDSTGLSTMKNGPKHPDAGTFEPESENPYLTRHM